MKKITAYINTVRIHWLVEELESIGIMEIMVTEYFSPSSKISRMEFLSQDEDVEKARWIIHRVGTTGSAGDHSLFIEEYDPNLPSQIPLGQRTSKLEESHIKQVVNVLLFGSEKRIRLSFLLITISILSVAMFIKIQMEHYQESAQASTDAIRLLSKTTNAVESAALEEMLAAERFHRGERISALKDFQIVRKKLAAAIFDLYATEAVSHQSVDSLRSIEQEFHLITGSMLEKVDSLLLHSSDHLYNLRELSKSHSHIMSSLDNLRLQLRAQLSSIQGFTTQYISQKRHESNLMIDHVRVSLLLLALAAIVITVMIWLIIERSVSRPIRKLMQEAKSIDPMELS